MMHDLDEIDSKTDWKTPVAKNRHLSSLLEEGSTIEPSDPMPQFHRWLSEVCGYPGDSILSSLLNFPSERPEPKMAKDNLDAFCRHFWAAIYLARLLAEEPV